MPARSIRFRYCAIETPGRIAGSIRNLRLEGLVDAGQALCAPPRA